MTGMKFIALLFWGFGVPLAIWFAIDILSKPNPTKYDFVFGGLELLFAVFGLIAGKLFWNLEDDD